MFFANLALAEFLALFGAASVVTVALYLLSRSRQRHTVSTLRFWSPAIDTVKQVHRRRIDQPWSLLLQLLGLLALILAIAQLRIGNRDTGSRDHVLLLDTSSWMAAKAPGGDLLSEEKRIALRWLKAVPTQDRVMVVRVDAVPTPVTRFEADREKIESAIRSSAPGFGAFSLDQALAFAENAQRLRAQRAGETVYAGSGRIGQRPETPAVSLPAHFRALLVERPVNNIGLTKLSFRQSATDPQMWEAFVSTRNYSNRSRRVPFVAAFGGAVVANRIIDSPARSEATLSFPFRGHAAGWFEARLNIQDDLPLDDRAIVELPEQKALRVVVYSTEPDLLRPVLSSDPRLRATYASPEAYHPDPDADLMILDRMHPASPPLRDAIWIEPPARGSPIAIRTVNAETSIERWSSDHPLGAGMRSKDLRLPSATVFVAEKGDIAIAESAAGPLILARSGSSGHPKTVVIGFHPMRSTLRFELVTPLLFANIFRWMKPEVFRRWDVQASPVGTMVAPLGVTTDLAKVRVVSDDKTPVPFTIEDRELRFFSAAPATVRVLSENTEQVFALSLPRVAEQTWEMPASVRRDLSGMGTSAALPKETWQILTIFGILCFIAEWMLFGRAREARKRMLSRPAPSPLRRAS
jgi:hypothetical protein